MIFTFSVPGDPVPQGSMFAVRGQVLHSRGAALQQWRDRVAFLASDAMPPGWPTDDVYACELTFAIRRPQSHYRKAGAIKPDAPGMCSKRPDIDKLCRAVLDALTVGGVWSDDARVARLTATKLYGAIPRMTCTLQTL